MFPFLLLLFSSHATPSSHSLQPLFPNKCNESCNHLPLPFPFHLNDSCGSTRFNSFQLTCSNSTSLTLTLGSDTYRILDIFSDGIFLDSPGISSCRPFYDINSFSIEPSLFYGISSENLIRLYDCEDSSVCKVECNSFVFAGCEGNDSVGCCYPLSDSTIWGFGSGFSVFSESGCRGFSSWFVNSAEHSAKRGIKLEWAVPRNFSEGLCHQNAFFVNATMVNGGVRCQCETGFVGDGFAEGVGCLKSCSKDGRIAYDGDCHGEQYSKKKKLILAGVLVSALVLAAVIAYYALLNHPIKGNRWDPDPVHSPSIISFQKACRTKLFSYGELEDATKGFNEGQKLVYGTDGTAHIGVLADGSFVAVQKIQCESEQDLMWVLNRIEFLSEISHKNVTRLVGCCIEMAHMPLVVYEFFQNGSLREFLQQDRCKCLDWYRRIDIATEAVNALAYLQCDISPPIYYHDLKSSDIFLDHDYSVKLAAFWHLKPGFDDGLRSYNDCLLHTSDIYRFGVVLLEIIMGSNHVDLPALALPKISNGELDEIVDPVLCYFEQPLLQEQVQRVANLAVRCLSFGEDGRLGMVDVARELKQITKENKDNKRRGAMLEETFSTSSLLQMISMSPDSIYVP
ncbi:protein kinase superfamily protein [Tasmannia lanceolata]|uniref:protein kinase superfamily protein n=1 Tax=Tasmannia lanceolata TaxID=3420 RepID=UPI0040649CB1